MQQAQTQPTEAKIEQLRAKNEACKLRRQCEQEAADELIKQFSSSLQRAMKLAMEKGVSSWLSTLPVAEHGFTLHKGAFRDALCLRYGWRPQHLSSHCVCGPQFMVNHALSSPRGGYPSIQHNETRTSLPTS